VKVSSGAFGGLAEPILKAPLTGKDRNPRIEEALSNIAYEYPHMNLTTGERPRRS
jgi:hypothetical protein